MNTPNKRVEIVNTIIKKIASTGRGFFQYGDKTAELLIGEGKCFYKSEHTGQLICLSVSDNAKPEGWTRGGTLLALVRDFRDFINTGSPTNGYNGYGGLYCKHWGYSPIDMFEIQQLAAQLGYLVKNQNQTHE